MTRPLKHADTTWAVEQRVKAARPYMVIREFLQNALEASPAMATIRFDRQEFKLGDQVVYKLAITNYAAAMTREKLLAVMDLNASGDEKQQGSHANFGIGAKVSGLAASPCGVQYTSCSHGKAVRLHLERDSNGVYGIHEWEDGDRVFTVIDCSREYDIDELQKDWVEVVFFGVRESDDTFTEPFYDSRDTAKNWILRDINRRFYDLMSHSVQVFCPGKDSEAHDRYRRAKGLRFSAAPDDLDSMVEVEGIRIRYLTVKHQDTRHGYVNHATLVWRNETYSFTRGDEWKRLSRLFGFSFLGNSASFQVLLPDDYEVKPDEHRTSLVTMDGNHIVSIEDFAAIVYDHRPDWLLQMIEERTPKATDRSDSHKRRIQKLLERVKQQRKILVESTSGDIAARRQDKESRRVTPGGGGGGGGGGGQGGSERLKKLVPDADGEIRAAVGPGVSEPKVDWEEFTEDEMENMLANTMLMPASGERVIVANANHRLLPRARKYVLRNCAAAGEESDEFVQLVDTFVREAIEYALVRQVLSAESYETLPNWPERTAVDQAVNKYALTALAYPFEIIEEATQKAMAYLKQVGGFEQQ